MSAVDREYKRAEVYLELWLKFHGDGLLQKVRESVRVASALEERATARTVRPQAYARAA